MLCLEGHTKSTAAGVDGLRVVPVPHFDRPRLRRAVLSAVDNGRLPIDQAAAFGNPHTPFSHRS
jgi:hypothetical protein